MRPQPGPAEAMRRHNLQAPQLQCEVTQDADLNKPGPPACCRRFGSDRAGGTPGNGCPCQSDGDCRGQPDRLTAWLAA